MADTYISNAVQYGHDNDTDIIYGVVRNVAKQARDVAAGAWDTYSGADLGDYDISAGTASGGLWSGDFPEIANGFYIYQFRIRAGDNPASDDILLFNLKGYWNGSVFSSSALDANGRVDVSKIEGTDATNQIGDATHDEVVEGTITLRQAIKLILAVLTGKTSGGGTSTLTFRNMADSKDRLIVTVDTNGNRTAIGTRDGS